MARYGGDGMRNILAVLILGLAGCPYVGEKGYEEILDADGDGGIAERFGGPDCVDDNPDIADCDADGDGMKSVAVGGVDCDDSDTRIHPFAEEICDEIDNNCNGRIDDADDELVEAGRATFYEDNDGDGYGDLDSPVSRCTVQDGLTTEAAARDCDDKDPAIAPGLAEFCDTIDHNCDGLPTAGASDQRLLYEDEDGDGFGASAALDEAGQYVIACSIEEGLTFLGDDPRDNIDEPDRTDCDDNDANTYPGAPVVFHDGIDQDCDGQQENDEDGDGFPRGVDCDDTNAAISPDALEVCGDDIDNNCDGLDEHETPDLPDKDSYARDADGDGWIVDADGDDQADEIRLYCPGSEPSGWIEHVPSAVGDCDDSDPSVGDVNIETYGPDNDGDGLIGDVLLAVDVCEGAEPTNYVELTGGSVGDCNDNDAEIGNEAVRLYGYDGDGDGLPVDPTLANAPQPTEFCEDTQPPGWVQIVSSAVDCNDEFASVGVAQRVTFVRDGDGDGFVNDADGDGIADESELYCEGNAPNGWVQLSSVDPANISDCNDASAAVNPIAVETCDDLDNNCSGDQSDAVNADVYYIDNDGDGFGDAVILLCSQEGNAITVGGDCNDDNAAVSPNAPEVCGDEIRQDCDFSVDLHDCDKDGFVSSDFGGDDCEDGKPLVNPDATEICDGIDNDCDGDLDGDDDSVDNSTEPFWYLDVDGDGYGNPATPNPIQSCNQVIGSAANDQDCNDAAAAINPDALEACDGFDNDCDTYIDDDDTQLIQIPTYYRDNDEDGFGASNTAFAQTCAPPNDGEVWVETPGDCKDDNDDVNPGADEVCDGEDNDCDELTDDADEDFEATVWYLDGDGDGYGQDGVNLTQCAAPDGYSEDGGDCDDFDSARSPAAAEVCDNLDNNCNGLVDGEENAGAGGQTWYFDGDNDGYGSPLVTVEACFPPAGYTADNTDCDDARPTTYPGAVETCDGIDNDCNNAVDDSAQAPPTWYADTDLDGFGDANDTIPPQTQCTPPLDGLTWVTNNTDCNDDSATINPTANEFCDGADNDCDGDTDDEDDAVVNRPLWYPDGDLDGFGALTGTIQACTQPPGTLPQSGDCDDSSQTVNPVAPEICGDSIDNDCDGLTDSADPSGANTLWWIDSDEDGHGDENDSSPTASCQAPGPLYATNNDDCDDGDEEIYPLAPEECNGSDTDCNGLIDDGAPGNKVFYADVDGDGFGGSTQVTTCVAPNGYVTNTLDCADGDASINPLAQELCAAGDEDCDGLEGADDPTLVDGTVAWPDNDLDGEGWQFTSVKVCQDQLDDNSHVLNNTDCNDNNGSVNTGELEVCDGLDNNCDGAVDESGGSNIYYRDNDGDGYGDLNDPSPPSCSAPFGYVANSTDCADSNASRNPGAQEVCGGGDEDCDGLLNNNDPSATGTTTYFIDSDGDGAPGTAVQLCSDPGGTSLVSEDCDDNNPLRYNANTETCDGTDNDCNYLVDDVSSGGALIYADVDGDGWGDDGDPGTNACSAPVGFVTNNGDCNDNESLVNPSVLFEDCATNDDDDCSGDNTLSDFNLYFNGTKFSPDDDSDTYGDRDSSDEFCVAPPGWVSDDTDCDDTNTNINPGATELCTTTFDDDCNLLINDQDPGFKPDATTNLFVDNDGDGHGAGPAELFCELTHPGYANTNDDCDDTLPEFHPGAYLFFNNSPVATLQETLDLACTNMTIDLAGSFVYESVIVDGITSDGLTLLGNMYGGSELRGDSGPALTVSAGKEITVDGLNLATDADNTSVVVVDTNGTLNLFNAYFYSDYFGPTPPSRGGAIHVVGAELNYIGGDVGGFTATGEGGGIAIDDSVAFIQGVSFNDNTALEGGALWTRLSTVAFDDLAFYNNSASADGGAVHIMQSFGPTYSASLSNSYFGYNQADYGGALLSQLSDLTITDVAVEQSYASVEGDTFWLNDGNYIVDGLRARDSGDVVFAGNQGSGTLIRSRIDYSFPYFGRAVHSDGFSGVPLPMHIENTIIAGADICIEATQSHLTVLNSSLMACEGHAIFEPQAQSSGSYDIQNSVVVGGPSPIFSTDTPLSCGYMYSDQPSDILPCAGSPYVWSQGNLRTYHDSLPPYYLDPTFYQPALQNQGDPSILDLDGSPSTHGHQGGPNALDYFDDFDGDGLNDGWERHWSSHSFFRFPSLGMFATGFDNDFDGWSDDYEHDVTGTSPFYDDTDLDGCYEGLYSYDYEPLNGYACGG